MINAHKPNLTSIYQHPRDLSLAVFFGEPTQPLTVIQQARVDLAHGNARFQVIAESHAVHLKQGDTTVFCELLSCAPIAADTCTYLTDFKNMQPLTYTHSNKYSIRVCFDEPHWHIPKKIENQYLKCEFPPVFGHTPLTCIQWQSDAHHLHWWTLHTYPLDENRVISVHTSSTLEDI